MPLRLCELPISRKGDDMSETSTLVVRFRVDEAAKQEFIAKLRHIFTHIVREAVLNGRGSELVDLATSNLLR
jgi:hypothetical protein